MNDIEILEKYINLIKKGYCDDCIDNYPHRQIAQAIENILKERQADKEKIKELEEENKKLKEITNTYEAIKKDYIMRDDIEDFIKSGEPLIFIADKKYFENEFLTENFIPKAKIKEKIDKRRNRLIIGKRSYTNKVRINELNLLNRELIEKM